MRSPTYAHAVAQLAQRLGPPFQDTGGMPQMRATLMSAALVTEAVRKMRQGAAGLKPRLDALESQPAGWSAWEQWQAERPGLEADLLYLPDEQQLALQQRLQALGSQILGAAVADLVASAPPASGGMPAWPEIKRRIALLARITDPSAPVQAARTELLARRDALVDGVAAVLRAELDAVPATAAGNAALPAWYGRFNAELPDPELRQLPGAQALWRDFLRRRADQMALMQPQWLARVQAAPDNAALAAMQREMFPLPGDLNTPTGVQINAAMNERREQFHKASVLGAQAQAAPAVAAVERGRPTAATTAGSGEPTAEEMYDALQAKLKQFAANTAELQTQGCGAVKNRSNNPMDAMACLAGSLANSHGGAQPMRISQFQKLACAPASGQPGWVCDYLMGFSGGMVTAMGTLGSMAASGQRSQSRFIRSGTGWISLPMEKR
ncbi:MAG TPA: hypothetical protein VGE36_05415 [Roseateles sp.]